MSSDACCWLCKTPSGVCSTGRACDHHKDARKRDDADDKARQTVRDPTGNTAVNNVMRAQRKGRRRGPHGVVQR